MRTLTACLLLLPLAAQAGWRSVAGESTLEFVPSYEGTELPGRFGRFEVHFDFDPAAPAAACLIVTVEAASADMDDADLNEGIAGPDFFHFAEFPTARFESRSVRAAGTGFVAAGELELKGSIQPVEVPFAWRREGGRAVMDGSLTLSRHAFGIGAGDWAQDDTIGERVGVRFHVVLDETP